MKLGYLITGPKGISGDQRVSSLVETLSAITSALDQRAAGKRFLWSPNFWAASASLTAPRGKQDLSNSTHRLLRQVPKLTDIHFQDNHAQLAAPICDGQACLPWKGPLDACDNTREYFDVLSDAARNTSVRQIAINTNYLCMSEIGWQATWASSYRSTRFRTVPTMLA